jgi:hypothetical protein
LATGLFSRDILFERFEAALLGLPVADLDLLSPLTLQEGVAEPGPTAQALPAAGKE